MDILTFTHLLSTKKLPIASTKIYRTIFVSQCATNSQQPTANSQQQRNYTSEKLIARTRFALPSFLFFAFVGIRAGAGSPLYRCALPLLVGCPARPELKDFAKATPQKFFFWSGFCIAKRTCHKADINAFLGTAPHDT
jgi:hypothetical protein